MKLNHKQIRVSSVLNRDTTNYGKQNLIDGQVETCWNSEQVFIEQSWESHRR